MTRYIVGIAAFLLILPIRAQELAPISFKHVGLNDGLSQSTVIDITQDKQDNMWFATHYGLNRFDGYDFTVFLHDEQDAHSIGHDVIRTCITDKQGQVWAGTDDGLSLYDRQKELFRNFSCQENGKSLSVNAIVEMDNKQFLLLMGTDHRLMQFDTETGQFAQQALHAQLTGISPTAICRQDDHVYIGSYQGLFVYSLSSKTVTNLVPEKLKGKQILAILQQSPAIVWVGTEGDGLFRINPQTQEVVNYQYQKGRQDGIQSNYIRSLALDGQGRLWIGTINSLEIFNAKQNTFSSYTSDDLGKDDLSQSSVRDIFMDSQGGMWLGTYFGGVNYYHHLNKRFHDIQSSPYGNSLSDNIIGCIREDRQKKVWIGTNHGGLNCYDTQTGKFTRYTVADGLASNDIKCLYVDETGDRVYIGTHTGGLSILNRKTGAIETVRHRKFRNIHIIEPAENGELWISGISSFMRFNPREKTFCHVNTQADGRPLLPERIVTSLRDSKHRLWLGGESGLAVYIEDKDGLRSCPLIPDSFQIQHRFIHCIYEARNGHFWIGTRSGLFGFDETTGKMKRYTTAQGLSNNVIHGILEDTSGKLWLSTNKGIDYFQPDAEVFRNYTVSDGLSSNQFTDNACCRTADGRMYFGSINGLTTFQPELLADNPYTPPVVITNLKVFNKTVSPGDETGILKAGISETRQITLPARYSMFSLEFVVSNYISFQHNTFMYMLEGYDKEWYRTTKQRSVSYSNLPQGHYNFLVKAANNDGKWNNNPTVLEITVLPVWYKTWWAILLFFLAVTALAGFIIRYFWMRKSMAAQLQMERIDKERQHEVNEMKLRFFINISHELRTPLTMILAPLQDVMDRVDDRWIKKQLEHIYRNTHRLLHLVNQLMDYRRAELGVFALKARYNHIHRVVEKNFLFYDKVAQHKKIAYNFHSEVEDENILCDPSYMELIVNNLLSNAFKYTDEGKSIDVTLKTVGQELLLQVRDTGNGIPADKQGKIFDRFYQADNEHIGSGIGLSLVQRLVELHHGRIVLESAEGQGSTFSIYLPVSPSSYKEDEIADGQNDETKKPAYTTNSPDMYVADADNETDQDTTPEEIYTEEERNKERIVIAEDNAEIRRYLTDELGEKYRVIAVENGAEALACTKEQEVDMILTDVMMPVMDGLQLCKQIKQNLSTSHIPVIILSAKTDFDEQMKGLNVGADDYISKPFSMAMVQAKIKNLFRTRYRAIEFYSKSLEIEPEKIALNPLDEELLKKAMAVVESHLDDVEFSTDQFAREMYMSRSNLHLKMKALTGESTNEFIRKVRFNKACKLLKEGKYTVTEISGMVGFNTPSYFSTSFKKYFGCLPSEYGK